MDIGLPMMWCGMFRTESFFCETHDEKGAELWLTMYTSSGRRNGFKG